jgi:hypothetical protein
MPFPQELVAPTYAKGTMPVGTPVKVFAPYVAPAFTTPAVPLGGIVTSVTLQSTTAMDQANVPFTFGQPFKRGDLAPDCALVGAFAGKADLPLQVNVKATHDDGSVRHAIISGVLPSLPAGASVVMGLKRAARVVDGGSMSLPASLPAVALNIAGVAYTATPRASAFTCVWLAGSLLTDYVANVPFVDASGSAHPTLTAQFSVRSYSSGAVRVDAIIEHCKAYASTTDVTYDVTIAANGATVYSQTGLVHTPCARWKKSFWYGTAPALHIKHDTAYLIASRAVPNYDQGIKIPESVLAGYATQLASGKFAPMSFGNLQPAMPTTGGRPDLGIMPDTYVAAVLSMDKRAKDIMLASADVAGSWAAHRRDDSSGPMKGMPLSVLCFPYATVYGSSGDCANPMTGKNEYLPKLVTTSKGNFDSSHQPGLYYLPYLLTGDFYYLEGLHFWCAWNAYNSNCAYRGYEKGLVTPDQMRGQGWSLRTLAECAAITPDDWPTKQQYVYWYESNMKWYLDTYLDATNPIYANQLGIITNGAVVYPINGVGSTGIAPWQDDFFTQALGHSVELLGYDSAKCLLKWKAKFQVGRMIGDGVCQMDAAVYSLGVRSTATSPYFASLAECYKFTLSADMQTYACNSPERIAVVLKERGDTIKAGDVAGYATSTEGYPANYQPALAAAVDSGYTDGLKAWSMFAARPTKPDYSTGAQFAILPRLVTEAVTAPAPAPSPTPVPAPTPMPDPAPIPVVTVRYQEAKAVDVMAAYAKSLTVPTGETVSGSDWFFDAAKGVVVFKVTTTK